MVLIFALSNTEAKKELKSLTNIKVKIEYVDSEGNQLSNDELTKDLIIRFPYITGSFFGRTENEAVFLEKANQKYEIDLDLLKREKMVKGSASKLSKQWIHLGLNSKPKSVKLLRIGTFPYDSITKKLIASAAFKQTQTGDLMMLIYVNKKSTFVGEVILDNEKYIHDISFPSKGFYWLLSKEISQNLFKIQQYSNDKEVILSIIKHPSYEE